MAYALITDSQIQSIGRLPESARRLDTQEWVMGLATAPPDLVAATGWYEVVDTARPADTATTTHDRSVDLVSGTPTVVWTPRPKTPDETQGEAHEANRVVIEDRLRTVDLPAAQAAIDLPMVSVTGTTVAEVRNSAQSALRELQRLIRDGARADRREIRRLLSLLEATD